ncbi:MAG TPA: phosphatidate cytidylyltransferase [Usitatibacter sp.]|nr:phosphatidate cytidylyltransferase [Usitatibacter sp.]
MLLTRVITALAILPVVLGMLFFASGAAWSVFALAIALIACWEWSRMCHLSPGGQGAYLVASGAIGAFVWLMYLHLVPGNFVALALTGFIIATVFWIVGVPFWLANQLRPSSSTCAVAGWIVVWPVWFALVVLRDTSPWLLLALAALVWVADIAAYFAGKGFGKRKLAPAVSPGKTWEGVYGALAGVVAYGVALAWIANAYETPLTSIFDDGAATVVIVAMLGLTAVSVVGDLFESWMKRGAGLKDSSNLLPGHGGLLDRIDALTSTLPVAALALYARHAAG